MYTLFGFCYVSGVLRSSRIRSLEAGIMMFGGAIAVLALAPTVGVYAPAIPALGAWLEQNPSAVSMAVVMLGVGIASIVMGARIILGYERRVYTE
jgi:hypothetical protein